MLSLKYRVIHGLSLIDKQLMMMRHLVQLPGLRIDVSDKSSGLVRVKHLIPAMCRVIHDLIRVLYYSDPALTGLFH